MRTIGRVFDTPVKPDKAVDDKQSVNPAKSTYSEADKTSTKPVDDGESESNS